MTILDQVIVGRPPSRLKFLARLARYTSPQGLKRKKPQGMRYAILVAFLLWAYEKTIDELIELFDLCLAEAFQKSRRELKEFQLRLMARLQRALSQFREVTNVVLNEEIPHHAIRPTVYQQVNANTLQETMAEVEVFFLSGRKRTHLDFFDRRYSYFRRFAPAFLSALKFHNYADKESLLEALDVLRQMNKDKEETERLPPILEDVPTSFVPAQWRPRVLRRDGSVNRRDYEMCVLSELRDALRAGAVWLEGSRKYANLDSYLIPPMRWDQQLRTTYCEMVGVPEDGAIQLETKQEQLQEGLTRLDEQLPHYQHVRLEDGELVLSPLAAEEDTLQVEHPLTLAISKLLPPIQLGELLAEVDAWAGFSRELTHAGGAAARIPNLSTYQYATIVTQACNLTLSEMVNVSDLSYEQLLWCTNWYIREETLQAATNVLVDFQYQQQLSHIWGDGTFSSSDGQRFAVARETNKAAPLPRYFGYGRGLTVLTWTSDQHSQYGVRVTPPSIRESTYVLDAILDNETVLNIREHTTDTGGYTDMIFALFDLLGMQFSPRLRDIGDRNLYRFDRSSDYRRINSLLSRTLDVDLILDNWDDLLRVAASLKMGWVTASTFISKLQSFPRQHKLTQVLQEYGRLIRTIFIVNYL